MLWYLTKKERRKIMKKKFGFTLAEVLITLGIIGVVAAMTIPTLIANTNSARFRSQFKKSISTLSQAGLMAQAQYDIDYSTPANECGSLYDDPESANTYTICAIFNGVLSGHVMTDSAPTLKDGVTAYAPADLSVTVDNPAYLSLADGSLVVFSKSMTACHKTISGRVTGSNCIAYIDVNGTTLPNREVSCQEGAAAEGDDGGAGAGAGAGAGEGEEAGTGEEVPQTACLVPNDASHMTDIFPVIFHDATVEPFTQAGRYVLTTSK